MSDCMDIKSETRTPVILIVDDIEMNRNVLHDLVITLGCEPLLAIDGEAALAMIKEVAPDLVLLDIMMPGLDGYEVLKKMKADPIISDIPVIMITALDEIDSAIDCIQMGADDYLTKPFNPQLLRARVNSSLSKKQAHDREKRLHQQLQTSFDDLHKMEQIRDSLTNMIVHDLNNPITVVSATCSLTKKAMEENRLDSQTLRECLKNIGDASLEMIRLTRGILDVAKLESDEMPVNLAPVDAINLAKSIWQQACPQAEIDNINLIFSAPEDTVMVLADEELLRRVIHNLVSNALKHNQANIDVTLSVHKENNECLVCITDNGRGIREEDIDRVFDKFFQAKGRTGRKYGVGMGLAFCKMAVEAQNGRIWVDSEWGHGASFSIAFTLAS